MSETESQEIFRKMKELYESLIKGHWRDRLREGKIIHMTIKLGGPFEIWFEEPTKGYTPGSKKE